MTRVIQYGSLFLIDVGGTTPAVLDKLEEFIASGGRVFCIGKYPYKSVGLKDWEKRDAEIASRVEKLKARTDRFVLLEKPKDGKYLEWYSEVMKKYSLPHAVTIETPDRFLLQSHFVMDDRSDVFLFVNANLNEDRCSEVVFPKSVYSGKTAWLYDAESGERYRLPISRDGRTFRNHNIGKWPEWDEVREDLKKLGDAFPFLDMYVYIIDCESCEGWEDAFMIYQAFFTKVTIRLKLRLRRSLAIMSRRLRTILWRSALCSGGTIRLSRPV